MGWAVQALNEKQKARSLEPRWLRAWTEAVGLPSHLWCEKVGKGERKVKREEAENTAKQLQLELELNELVLASEKELDDDSMLSARAIIVFIRS